VFSAVASAVSVTQISRAAFEDRLAVRVLLRLRRVVRAFPVLSREPRHLRVGLPASRFERMDMHVLGEAARLAARVNLLARD
jgi:hypothetical protein